MGKSILNQMDAMDDEHNKRLHFVIAAVTSSVLSSDVGQKFTVIGKLGNRTDADYSGTVKKIMKLKQSQRFAFHPNLPLVPYCI